MFSDNAPVGVLIHGCHLQAVLDGRSWQNLIYGSDTDIPTMSGRAVMGIYVALHRRARLVTFSTGASEKEGLKEAEYTYKFVLDHAEPIAQLLSQKLNVSFTGDDLREWLKRRAVLDVTSQNTVEETAANLALALERKCKEVISVTNAFHAPRCLAGLQQARIKYDSPLLVSTIPAFDQDHSTVIIEPPHRGDMPKVPYHVTAKGIFGFLKDPALAFEFNDEWTALIEDFKYRQAYPVVFEGARYFPRSHRIRQLVENSAEPLRVTRTANAGRTGLEVRAVDPEDGKPRRMYLWDDGQEYDPIEPGSPAYGPDGQDTGW